MGKILISNGLELEDYFKNLKTSIVMNEKCGRITVYKKINVFTHNYFVEGSNYVLGVGTYIYKSKKDSEALKEIYYDLKENTLNSIRKNIYGTYCIITKINEEIKVFIDILDSYRIYYHFAEDGSITLTNTWSHIYWRLGNTRIDKHRLAQYICNDDNIAEKTPVDGINRLLGTQTLKFVNGVWEICEEKELYCSNIDYCGDFWKDTEKSYKEISNTFKDFGIFYTGGLDSRTVLSFLLSGGINPKLFYAVGNSRMTNTKKMDEYLFELTARMFNLNYQLMNWNDSDWDQWYSTPNLNLLGEYSTLHNANQNYFNELKSNIDVECVLTGFFGELFRNYDMELSSVLTANDAIKNAYANFNIKNNANNLQKYFKVIKEDFENLSSIYDCSFKNYKIEDFGKYLYILKKPAITKVTNFLNLFLYSFPIIPNIFCLKDYFDLKFQDMDKAKFIVRGMNNIDARLTNIPIYSRHVLRKINEVTFEMENQNKRVEGARKKLLRIYPVLRKTFIRDVYFLLKGDMKGFSEKKEEDREIKKLWRYVDQEIIFSIFDEKKLHKNADSIFLKTIAMLLQILNNKTSGGETNA